MKYIFKIHGKNETFEIEIKWQWAMSLLHYAQKLGFYYLDVVVEKYLPAGGLNQYEKLMCQYYVNEEKKIEKVVFGEFQLD